LVAAAALLPLASIAAEAIAGYAGIHDSVYARSIVLDNGIHKAVLIALETTKVPGGYTAPGHVEMVDDDPFAAADAERYCAGGRGWTAVHGNRHARQGSVAVRPHHGDYGPGAGGCRRHSDRRSLSDARE